MAAPLEIGSNILNMNQYDLETYMNTEVPLQSFDFRNFAIPVITR